MKPRPPGLWKAPTRRSFVAMLGGGLAAIALRRVWAAAEPDDGDGDGGAGGATAWAGTSGPSLWIGHC